MHRVASHWIAPCAVSTGRGMQCCNLKCICRAKTQIDSSGLERDADSGQTQHLKHVRYCSYCCSCQAGLLADLECEAFRQMADTRPCMDRSYCTCRVLPVLPGVSHTRCDHLTVFFLLVMLEPDAALDGEPQVTPSLCLWILPQLMCCQCPEGQ